MLLLSIGMASGTIIPGIPDKDLPFVSICTPTFNRRPFWPIAIKCFEEYTYPKDKIEWIIVDDGSDKIEDMVSHIPEVKYFRYEDQMVLGRKRNLMHSKSKGDIIVYQDDDDYYPPERITHAVETLLGSPEALAAGSSVLFLYFKHISQMYRFGPYGPNHATAGTFAFKRKLLETSKYDEHAALAEEKSFLKNYTVPFVQLDPLKTILVFSHEHNTFDKRELLASAPNPTCNPDMNITVKHILKNEEITKFFLNDIDDILAKYEPGEVKNKPEVLNQIKNLKATRQLQMEEQQKIREETMKNEDVKRVISDVETQMKENNLHLTKICELNKRLIAKTRAIVDRVKGIELDDETKHLIELAEKQSIPMNMQISKTSFTVVQDESRLNMTPQDLNTIMNFIASNYIEMEFTINNDKTVQQIRQQNIPLAFNPHPSQNEKWVAIQKQHAKSQPQLVDVPTINPEELLLENESYEVKTVVLQTKCTISTAKKALEAKNNDVIQAIMNIDDFISEETVENKIVATVGSGLDSESISQEISNEIQTIMKETGCNVDIAKKTYASCNEDLVDSILQIMG